MNDSITSHIQLATTLRQFIVTVRETRERVVGTAATPVAANVYDDEAIHDFRVALRRLRTLLRASRKIWSSKKIIRVEKDLQFFARVTGKLRDDEVLRTSLASLALLDAERDEVTSWLDRRAHKSRSEERSILRVVREGPSRTEACRGRDKPLRPLNESLDRLEKILAKEPTRSSVGEELAYASITRAIDDVRAAAQADGQDVAAMHALRIREKRLRYTAEAFADVLGKEGSRLVSHATRMQRRLGELHDVDEAIATVTRARGLTKSTQRSILDALRIARVACAAKVEPHLIEARGLAMQLDLSRNGWLSNSST